MSWEDPKMLSKDTVTLALNTVSIVSPSPLLSLSRPAPAFRESENDEIYKFSVIWSCIFIAERQRRADPCCGSTQHRLKVTRVSRRATSDTCHRRCDRETRAPSRDTCSSRDTWPYTRPWWSSWTRRTPSSGRPSRWSSRRRSVR